MIWSVWNHAIRGYDYYRSPDPDDRVNTPSPKHIPRKDHGVPPDRASWPLPKNAVKIGSGELARGRIASTKAHELAGLADRNIVIPMSWVATGVAAWLLWRWTR